MPVLQMPSPLFWPAIGGSEATVSRVLLGGRAALQGRVKGAKKWGFSPGFPISQCWRCPDFGDSHGVEQTFMSAVIASKNDRALTPDGFVTEHGIYPFPIPLSS